MMVICACVSAGPIRPSATTTRPTNTGRSPSITEDAPLDVGGVHLVEEADLVPVDDEVLVVELHRAL